MRGLIVRVNLTDATPPEMNKTRPAIILSNTEHNKLLESVVVVPLSTRPPSIWPLRMELPAMEGLRKSYAVVPGIRQISKARIVAELAIVPESFLNELHEAVVACLND